jgi:molybdopterin-guanine dinucleotide biosynthesis protein MobB
VTSKIKTLINDLEISFCGYSNSGKTTLITKLIEKLSGDYSIGYLKHDAHHFDMDREGKDTFKAKQAGAKCVHINSSNGSATLRSDSYAEFDLRDNFLDCDFALIEGYKNEKANKILVLGNHETREKTLKEYREGKFSNVLAIVGRGDCLSDLEIPYFDADDIDLISKFILGNFKNELEKRPLYGLVLSGGRSTRMGQDKGSLNYHGVSQTEHLYNLLKEQCDEVYVSCRSEQATESHIKGLNTIEDQLINMGPIGGILSAMLKYREARFMVMACDLPFVDSTTIAQLSREADPFKVATSFINPEKLWAEPLCTIYEPKAFLKLFKVLGLGKKCPRKVLLNSNIKTIHPENKLALDNANTPMDLERVNKFIEETL